MSSKKTVVVLMPTFNDWISVAELLPKIDRHLADHGYRGRIVVVDDGSSNLAGRERIGALLLRAIEQVSCLTLYRNCGHQRALAIGVSYCAKEMSGDYLVTMDSDLEDNPEYIPLLVEACAAGHDAKIVFAERTKRSEGLFFRAFYRCYQAIYRAFTGMKIAIGNYSALPWGMVERVANIAELWSHYPAAIMRARIPFTAIPARRGKRVVGDSKMNFQNMVLHGFGAFSVHAETVGARTLTGVVVAGPILLVLFLGSLANAGWPAWVAGAALFLLFQLAAAASFMIFVVITVRMHSAMIPVLEYRKFILNEEQLIRSSAQPGA